MIKELILISFCLSNMAITAFPSSVASKLERLRSIHERIKRINIELKQIEKELKDVPVYH
jgi:uncharacterized protein (UPF0335 family)